MAIQEVRLRSRVAGVHAGYGGMARGPSVAPAFEYGPMGWGAVYDGIIAVGKGVREVGKTIRSFNSVGETMAADHAYNARMREEHPEKAHLYQDRGYASYYQIGR